MIRFIRSFAHSFAMFFTNLFRMAYVNSPAWERDKEAFRNKTGYHYNDPVFKEFGWVPPDKTLGQQGFYVKNNNLNGPKYQAINGQMTIC